MTYRSPYFDIHMASTGIFRTIKTDAASEIPYPLVINFIAEMMIIFLYTFRIMMWLFDIVMNVLIQTFYSGCNQVIFVCFIGLFLIDWDLWDR